MDYLAFESELVRIDELLRQSGIEDAFIRLRLESQIAAVAPTDSAPPTVHQILLEQKHARRAPRCMVLKGLLGACFRELSRRIAECALLQWFCEVDELIVDLPSKSTLQRDSVALPRRSCAPLSTP